MEDTIIRGSVAGLFAGAVGLIFSHALFLLGLSPMSSLHLAASLVVIDVLNLTTGGVILSIFTHLTVAAFFGIVLTGVLQLFGKDYWIVKGIGTGVLFCLIAHSYLIPLMRTDAQVRNLIFNPSSFATILLTHGLIGLIASFIIVRYS